MDTFYTIIKIAPNSLTDDCLSIGMLAFDGEKYWLKFSNERKNTAKRLVKTNSESIEFVVKQLTKQIEQANKPVNASQNTLISFEGFLNSDFFNYLNIYSNGIVRFAKPLFLNEILTEDTFLNLFRLFVDNEAEKNINDKVNINEPFYKTIESNLIKRVESQIHTNLNIDSSKLPGLYFQFEMDCIGLNGAFVGAKAIPFTKSMASIDKEISHYIALISFLKNQYNRESDSNNFYLIANEPSQINSHEHKTWESLLHNPFLKLIQSDEVELIADKVEESGATTFMNS